jgi:hypothetical protein
VQALGRGQAAFLNLSERLAARSSYRTHEMISRRTGRPIPPQVIEAYHASFEGGRAPGVPLPGAHEAPASHEAPTAPHEAGAAPHEPSAAREPSATDRQALERTRNRDAPTRRPDVEAEATGGRRSTPEGEAEVGGAVRRTDAEVADAAARSRQPLPEGVDPNRPANRLTDAELADTTTRNTRIGDTDHHAGFRRRGESIVGEVCSAGCQRVEQALRLAENALPPGELRDRVTAQRERVERLQEQLAENIPSISHRDLLEVSGQVANTMRDAGSAARGLGRALNNPRLAAQGRVEPMFEHTYEPRAAGEGAGYDRIRVDNLAVPDGPSVTTSQRRTIDVEDFRTLNLDPDAQIIYVVRDKRSGAVAKVGETDGQGMRATFEKYATASEGIGMGPRQMEIEVNVVSIGEARGLTQRQARRAVETELRHRLEGEGHIQPWENYDPAGRMGREGSGIPFVHPGGGHGAERGVGHGARGTPAAGWRPLTGIGGVPGIRSDVKATPQAVAGHIAEMIRTGAPMTRTELARRAGVDESRVRRWMDSDAWRSNMRAHGVDVSTWPPTIIRNES